MPTPRNARDADRPLTAVGVAEGVQRSYEAFLRALPDLLRQRGSDRLWAAFHGDDFVAIGKTQTQPYRMCEDLGFAHDSFFVGWISPQSKDGVEEIDPSLFEFEDIIPDTID